MAVVIRMKRTGRRHRPCYRISVADSRKARDGRVLDSLGLYDPIAPKVEDQLRLDVDKARDWLDRGALPSETVASIFRRQGVYEGRPTKKKRTRTGRNRDTATKRTRTARSQAVAERKDARRAARVEAARAAKAAAAEATGDE